MTRLVRICHSPFDPVVGSEPERYLDRLLGKGEWHLENCAKYSKVPPDDLVIETFLRCTEEHMTVLMWADIVDGIKRVSLEKIVTGRIKN